MHIVLTVNKAWNILNFRRPLVEALVADGHRVTILAPYDETVPDLIGLGAQFENLPMDSKSLALAGNLALAARFHTAFRKLAPDIVLSFTIKNNLFGAVAARMLRIPFLPNITGLGTIFLGSRALFLTGRQLYRWALGSSAIVFVQNEDDRDFLVSNRILDAGQLQLLPGSGIDTERFDRKPLPDAAGGFIFLMVSRLLRDKGIVEFLDAARQVRKTRPDARFRILGPLVSPNRSALPQAELRPFLDDGTVEHLGETSDVRPFIEAAHCVVLPSYREGAPRSLIEAASMGRPVIATDVPGCRAVVDHERTGLLCAARDAGALAGAMEQLLDLPESAREAMAAAGRRKMETEFSVDKVIAAYRAAIAQLTTGTRNDHT